MLREKLYHQYNTGPANICLDCCLFIFQQIAILQYLEAPGSCENYHGMDWSLLIIKERFYFCRFNNVFNPTCKTNAWARHNNLSNTNFSASFFLVWSYILGHYLYIGECISTVFGIIVYLICGSLGRNLICYIFIFWYIQGEDQRLEIESSKYQLFNEVWLNGALICPVSD